VVSAPVCVAVSAAAGAASPPAAALRLVGRGVRRDLRCDNADLHHPER